MRLDEANQLLDPGHLAFESGWLRLEVGQLHVSAFLPALHGSLAPR